MFYIIKSQTKSHKDIFSCSHVLHELKEKALRLLSWLHYQSQYRKRLIATHAQIAEWLNMSPSSVKRAFITLSNNNLCWWTMKKINPKYSAPNEYFLHDDLRSLSARDMMDVFFKNFFKLPLFSLFFKPHSVGVMENDLPNISNKDLNKVNKFTSWKERFLEAHFLATVSHPQVQSYLVDAQQPAPSGERPSVFGSNKPINGIEAAPSVVAICDELCQIGLHKPWCEDV